MTEVRRTLTIDAPIASVYQQWLDLESFPQFVPGVREVTLSADFYSHWTLSIGGLTREFDAEIVEQLPEERVRWRTITGDVAFTGQVSFAARSKDETDVTLSVEWTPSTAAERAAVTFGADDRAVRATLKGFKKHIEEHDGPTGHSYVTLKSVDPER